MSREYWDMTAKEGTLSCTVERTLVPSHDSNRSLYHWLEFKFQCVFSPGQWLWLGNFLVLRMYYCGPFTPSETSEKSNGILKNGSLWTWTNCWRLIYFIGVGQYSLREDLRSSAASSSSKWLSKYALPLGRLLEERWDFWLIAELKTHSHVLPHWSCTAHLQVSNVDGDAEAIVYTSYRFGVTREVACWQF